MEQCAPAGSDAAGAKERIRSNHQIGRALGAVDRYKIPDLRRANEGSAGRATEVTAQQST
jgi:hypothetical protein